MSELLYICELCKDTIQDNDRIICPHCSIDICESCFQYSITMDLQNPICIYCKKNISIEFIISNNSTLWCKTVFLEYYSNLLLEQEKSKLSDTIPKYKIYLKIRYLKQERLGLLTNKGIKNSIKKLELRNNEILDKITFLINERNDKKMCLTAEIDELDLLYTNKKKEKKEKILYIKKCPNQECNGFINSKYFCDLCSTKICEACMNIQEDEHICNRDDIETADLIKKSSKSCPKCFTSIFKISGCNQMFCTSCQCVFDWESLKIETGSVHNQHYFDWITTLQNSSTQARVEIDACGNIDDIYHRLLLTQSFRKYYITSIYVANRELENYIIPLLTNKFKNNFEKYRILFLDNEITNEKWKKKLINDVIFNENNQSYIDVLNMFVTVTSDFIRKLCYGLDGISSDNYESKIRSFVGEIQYDLSNFVLYVKKCLNTILCTFGHTCDKNIQQCINKIQNYHR